MPYFLMKLDRQFGGAPQLASEAYPTREAAEQARRYFRGPWQVIAADNWVAARVRAQQVLEPPSDTRPD